MNSADLRQKFLDFFKGRGHAVIPSSSLVPENDPTVLFTTAGMQQFKRYYSHPDEAPAAAITTIQKCIRTGDIDEVGDNTHLTFFEMLGNFSFGYPDKDESYSKERAIKLAWEFLTEVLKIDKSRIYATYFDPSAVSSPAVIPAEAGISTSRNLVPEDTESLDILKSIDDLTRIVPQGFDDNFWSLGTENSPGGPTVEFYVDGIEIWNLVFNEYIYRGGQYLPAEYKGVDTGMGLERLITVLNGAENVYHTDLFEQPARKLNEIIHRSRSDDSSEVDGVQAPARWQRECRIILDHIKAAIFIINDGVLPSNKDRGYVLRRLIRRAIVKGQQLGITENFTVKIATESMKVYEGTYSFNNDLIETELDKEESKFRRTLKEGLKILDSLKEINGKDLFDLYQSFGLPLEISVEEAKGRRIEINNSTIQQFNNFLKDHQELSRTASAGMFKGGLVQGGEMETKYHTATHLLLAALRQVLGNHVLQRGSNITAERLRFDFSHPEKMTPEQIKEVEDLVNQKITEDLPVDMQEMSLEDAKNCGAMGVFVSKYGEKVKVYSIGKKHLEGERSDDSSEVNGVQTPARWQSGEQDYFSREICGGPHVTHTGKLGHVKIVKEEASSAGVRRIKAILE